MDGVGWSLFRLLLPRLPRHPYLSSRVVLYEVWPHLTVRGVAVFVLGNRATPPRTSPRFSASVLCFLVAPVSVAVTSDTLCSAPFARLVVRVRPFTKSREKHIFIFTHVRLFILSSDFLLSCVSHFFFFLSCSCLSVCLQFFFVFIFLFNDGAPS